MEPEKDEVSSCNRSRWQTLWKHISIIVEADDKYFGSTFQAYTSKSLHCPIPVEPEKDEISSCNCNRSRCQGRLKSDSGVSSIISKRVTYISVINVPIVARHQCTFNIINIGLEIYNQVYTAEEDPVNWDEGDKVWFKIKSSFDICTCIKKPLLCGQWFEYSVLFNMLSFNNRLQQIQPGSAPEFSHLLIFDST